MNIVQETFDNLKKNPFKALITFVSVGTGVGILIFALSISQLFSDLLENKVNAEGVVLTVSNSELQADGSYEQIRPSQLDMNAKDLVADTVEGVSAASVLLTAPFNELTADGKKYQLRSATGGSEDYFEVMGLEVIAGTLMSADDVESGSKKMWLSESTAVIAFGSVEAALDQQIETPSVGRGPNQNRTPSIYTVAGVYEDADELKRVAYGIGDVVVPYTSSLPTGNNAQRLLQFLGGTFIVKADNADNVESQIRSSLAFTYGDDVELNIWEGTMQGPSSLLDETRDSVSQLTLVINLLGFILLISGAIGILSIMMVEILGKTREIALERALGASVNQVAKKFLMQSMVLSGVSAIIGVVLAYFFAQPLADIVGSVFSMLSAEDLPSSIIQLDAILIGAMSAIIFGGVFGVLPVFSLTRTPIAEGLRDA